MSKTAEYERRRKNRSPEQQKDLDKQRNWWKLNKRKYKSRKRKRGNRREEYKRYHTKLNDRSLNGKCKHSNHCNEPLAGETKYCLRHWCNLIKNNNHGKKKTNFDVDLLEIWNEQEGKCFYTGIPLIPGKTASLDHVQPLSKNGTNNKENLRFVHILVNCMKQDLTIYEFKEQIKIICPKLLVWAKGE